MALTSAGPAARVMAVFALHATLVASLFLRLPEVQLRLGLSEAVYGLVLLAMPIGVVAGSMLVPALVERWGPRRVLTVALPLATALQIPAAFAVSAPTLGAALLAFGFVFGIVNVTENIEADRVEVASGARIMNRCHGWWALGFLAASLAATGLVAVGLAPVWQFAGHAALMAAATPLVLNGLPESRARTATGPARRFALPGRGTIRIGLFALASLVIEGIMRNWSVIHLRDTLGAAEWVATLALPAVVATQTLGRFLGDGWVIRHGVTRTLRWTSVLLLAGMVGFALAGHVVPALVSCLLIGVGIAVVQPQGFAAAARDGARPAAESVAAFATFGTLVGFMSPPLFGGVVEALGFPVAFALLVPLPVLAILFANRLEP
ncbi:MFS transporter [Wenxinia marina]|uniref:Wenxma_19, whole genome shotgun sequence n=1 Tax=Wenxinia marina DSM 24838 TaxID=1123501 RepID=A0A0D0NHE9_9RHOB|nr:MFS transporter [Wenxinia marina]KIQ67735.1 Fucose permease [Wenxinia marina DSM 24838]GGL77616.1 MFS transporter [Wenxinia marina]